ncbi:helix-turn-helix domain-containing protein [Brevibacillus choshinensis]|uniref:winged helix-turn-helix domain-containing protein n=1 Tax=Brevibacillus choshinensis TaxID=54911 RepID=UPI00399C6D6C
MLTHLKRMYTREELLDQVWGMDYDGGTRTVDIRPACFLSTAAAPFSVRRSRCSDCLESYWLSTICE